MRDERALDLGRAFYLVRHQNKYVSGGLATLIEHIRAFTGEARSTDELKLAAIP